MATSTASNFNLSIGGLRQRGNADDQFNKAINDRLTMLKFDAPDAGEAKTAQTEVKGGAVAGALKTISDTQSTYKKGVEAYGKIKKAGQDVVSKTKELVDAGREIGEKAVRVPQQGLTALQNPLESQAVVRAKTTIKQAPQASQPTASQPQPSTQPSTRAQPDLPDLDDLKAQVKPDQPKGLPSVEDLKPMASGAEGDALDSAEHAFQTPVSQLTKLADFRQPGASLIAQVAGGGRSRAVAGATQQLGQRANAMNVRSMTNVGDTANAQLGNLTQSLTNTTRAGQQATGGLAKASTNIHADMSGALDEMKSQVGGALSDIQSHLANVSSQVAEVGKGVGAVGEDVADTATKVIGGVSKGLETAGVVADALGPIGDLLGLGMAIFGGIKAHQAHERAEQSNVEASQQVSQQAQQQTGATTGVSLDTSKPAQAVASSHY